MFVGNYERSLDDKGRLGLPASWRDLLDETGFLAQMDGVLSLYTPEGFNEAVSLLREQARSGEFSQDSLRVFSAGASMVKIDKQGRVTIPKDQRDAAGIDTETVVIGALNRIEIYRPERWVSLKENTPTAEIARATFL